MLISIYSVLAMNSCTHAHTYIYTHTQLQRHKVNHHDTTFSVETLLDALIVLYDECCTSSFKKEKTVQEFASSG